MSRATSYANNENLELAGPPLVDQCAHDLKRMKAMGLVFDKLPKHIGDLLEGSSDFFDPAISNSQNFTTGSKYPQKQEK